MKSLEDYKSFLNKYFEDLKKEIDDKYDTFLEVNRLDLNLTKLDEIRNNYLNIIESYKSKCLNKLEEIGDELKDEEEIKSIIFKNNSLVYLKSNYFQDRKKSFGKLIVFKEYASITKINFLK